MVTQERAYRLAGSVSSFADLEVWKLGARLREHPLFEAKLVDYCKVMSMPMPLTWPVNKLFSQKLRYITCYLLIGNYTRFQRDPTACEPPTLAALQRAAPASERQIAGFVNALKLGGYVIAEPGDRDRRMVHLRPGPALLREICRSPLAFLAAAEDLLQPERAQHGALLGDDDLLADWLGRSTEIFQQQDVLFSPFRTVVHFSEKDCGYPLLSAVMGAHFLTLTAGRGPDLPLTYDALAERFQVSRQHVGNMLTEADRHGWFSVAPGGRLSAMSADLEEEFLTWAAGQMAHFHLLAQDRG